MASLQGFYEYRSTTSDEKHTTVSVHLNAEHEVYEGHFPGQPIAPGAALTQMVLDEVAKIAEGQKVSQLRQIKFLAVLDPNKVSEIDLVFAFPERDGVKMFTCTGRAGETNYFKLNGIFS